MKTRAAVAYEKGKPLVIETVDLEGPKAGEVLVELKATGVCHTDEFTRSGADPEGLFPVIFGHEGAGIVQEVGAGVTSVVPGDHVILLYTPECRACKSCLSRKTNLCTAIRATQGQGLMPDGTSRFSIGGKKIHHYMGCSTFANHTVLPEIAVAKVRRDAPFDKICYIGCGVTTGVGAVLFTAKVEPGANVVVFGLGGIGLNVVQGARIAGADKIIGVDVNPGREAIARRFGLTHFVNPATLGKDVVAHLVELTGGGADYSFECVGNVNLMRQALECCHRGWGESIIIGVAGAGQEVTTRPFQLVTGRVWKGTAFGGARGRSDVPKLVDWYMDKKIEIDSLITHTLPLERINEAFDLMHEGKSIRTVIQYAVNRDMSAPDLPTIQAALEAAVEKARRNREGKPADYIPELATVPLERTSAAVLLTNGELATAGDADVHDFTFQSSAKLLVLLGLLEERGPVEVFLTVGSEPSGDSFGSVARLETHGPIPANPLINSGAIALCGQLRGSVSERVAWLSRWAERLYGAPIPIDEKVRSSERLSADRNRAIAYFLKHGGVIKGDVEEILDVYFALCSFSAGVREAAHLPAILANGGRRPGTSQQVLSKRTVAIVVSIMATCGMYNESGNYLVATGMPAKSGVSGVIVSVVPGIAGIAVSSPRLNEKGGSVRGHLILRELSRGLGWHFALAATEP